MLCAVFRGIADSEGINGNKALYDCCNDVYNTSSAVWLSMRYVQFIKAVSSSQQAAVDRRACQQLVNLPVQLPQ